MMRQFIAATFILAMALRPIGARAAEPPKLETATFAAGCFWGTEEFFRKIPGVMKTQVGYTGGTKTNPKYEDTQDGTTGHAESVEVQFDPKKVSYEFLLDQFFKMHDPTTLNRQGNDIGSQYRSAIFYHSEAQKTQAEAFKAKVEKSGAWKAPIVTEIAPAQHFWVAEDYHQKYLVKNPGGYDNHYLRKISFGATASQDSSNAEKCKAENRQARAVADAVIRFKKICGRLPRKLDELLVPPSKCAKGQSLPYSPETQVMLKGFAYDRSRGTTTPMDCPN